MSVIRQNFKEEIEDILNSYSMRDLIPSAKSWELWQSEFFNELDLKGQDMKYLEILGEIISSESRLFEPDFQHSFPDLLYKRYKSPMDYRDYYLTKRARDIIAFKLECLTGVSFSNIQLALGYFYRGKKWSYDEFLRCLKIVSVESVKIMIEHEVRELKIKMLIS